MIRIGAKPPPSFDDPVGVLEHCHRKLADRLLLLERAVTVLRDGGEPAAARAAVAEVLGHFEGPGLRHTEDEEFSVFPRLAGGAVNAVLDDLGAEHRVHEAILLSLRAVSERFTPELTTELEQHAAALAAGYREHMRREEDHVFPLARALDPAQLRAIGIEMRLRRGGGGD